MANDYSGYSPATGFVGFNYNTEEAKIQRQQAAAQALQQLSLKPAQPSYVQNGVGTFYAGPNGKVSAVSQVLAALLANHVNSENDQSQRNLDQTSQSALAYALDPSNDAKVRAAVDQQQATENAAQLQRESQRTSPPGQYDDPSSDNIDLGGGWNPASGAPQRAPATAQPVQAQQPLIPAPKKTAVSVAAMKKVATLLSSPTADSPGFNPAKDSEAASMAMPNHGLPSPNGQDNGPSMSDVWENLKRVGSQAKSNFVDSLHSIQHFTGADGSQPSWAAAPIAQPQVAPQGAQVPPAAPMPAPQQNPSPPAPMPPAFTQAQPAPMPLPQAAPQAQAQPAQQLPSQGGDPRTMLQQAAGNALASETPEDNIKQLLAIGNTGPMGQQIATARLNQLFGSKNGRFTTDVKADTVNGGFVAVTTDSATGQIVNVKPINAGSGSLITGQRTDGNGNVVNVHKDGSITPMIDPQTGAPVKDAAVTRSNVDAVSSLVTKRSDAQAKLADLQKMESDLRLASGLVGQANVGPLASSIGGVYNKYLGNSAANDTLDRVLNDTRLQQILQDKGGNGTVGAGLMNAYKGHSMSRDLAPSALAQGLGQALDTVAAQRKALEAEIGAHNFALGQLGFKDPSSAPAAPATSRAPGNYSF